MSKLHVVVVGAGIGGLGAALAFSRAGHRVTLVERDDTPMPADVEGAFDWRRTGAPQVRHPHAFLGLARTILRDRFPDVLDALADAGVRTVSMQNVGGMAPDLAERLDADDDLLLLGCRRTTFEWVLRRCVLAEANVELRVGVGVTGPPRSPGGRRCPRRDRRARWRPVRHHRRRPRDRQHRPPQRPAPLACGARRHGGGDRKRRRRRLLLPLVPR